MDAEGIMRLVHEGRYEEALAELDRGSRSDQTLRFIRGLTLHKLGRNKEALAELDGDYPEVRSLRGSVLANMGRRDEALHELDTAIMEAPRMYVPYHTKGAVLAARGMHEEAVRCLDRGIKMMKKHDMEDSEALAEMYARKTRSLLALGRKADAMRCADAGISATGGHHLARAARAEAAGGREIEICTKCGGMTCSHDGTGDLADVNNEVGELCNKGMYAEALKILESSGSRQPYKMGIILYNMGRHEEALASMDEAVAINQSYSVLYFRGMALEAMGRSEEALRDYGAAAVLDPSKYEAPRSKGKLLVKAGRPGEALASYRKATRLAKADDRHDEARRISMEHARALITLKRHGEAIQCYDEALADNPGDHELLHEKCRALRSMRMRKEALACYDEALVHSPGDYTMLYEKAALLDGMRRYGEAVQCYYEALEARPGDENAMLAGCTCLRKIKWHSEALRRCEEGIAAHPDNGEFLHEKGIILYETGRYAEALACCRQDPPCCKWLAGLGEACAKKIGAAA